MPELPDVEVLRKRVHILIGDTISSVDIFFPLTIRMFMEGTPQEILTGKKIDAISRRGKFLIFHTFPVNIAMNLMLTGRITVKHSPEHNPRNTVVRIVFESGKVLYFADYKKMGKIYVTTTLEEIPGFTELGMEPLSEDFTLSYFTALCTDTRPIKLMLTDQRLIAGIGNSYVDEILFDAKINPRKKAASLTEREIEMVYDSTVSVLRNGIFQIENRLKGEGNGKESGKEAHDFFNVHGKKGQPCPCCGNTLREISVSGRSTHVCPHCQEVTFP